MFTLSRFLRRRSFCISAISSKKERDLKELVQKLNSNPKLFRNNSSTYDIAVRSLASAKRFDLIQEIIQHQLQFKEELTKEYFNIKLIKLYGVSGMFDDAKQVFDEMPDRNCVPTMKSLNAILSASVHSGRFEEMEMLFREMEEKWNVKPDIVSFNIMINGFCKMGDFDRAVAFLEAMMGVEGLKPDAITFNTLLNKLYNKDNMFDEAEKMWKRMIESNVKPSLHCYNSRLVGLVNVKKFEDAIGLLSEMRKSGVDPVSFSYGAIIRGYCDEGNIAEVKKWYGEMVRAGHAPYGHAPYLALFEAVLSCACDQEDYDWCLELCKELFEMKYVVDDKLLQKVVDSMVKGSRIEEAKKVIEMGKLNTHCPYELLLPSGE